MSDKYLAMIREQENDRAEHAKTSQVPPARAIYECEAADWAAMREWVETLQSRLRESTEILRGLDIERSLKVEAQIAANEAALGER